MLGIAEGDFETGSEIGVGGVGSGFGSGAETFLSGTIRLSAAVFGVVNFASGRSASVVIAGNSGAAVFEWFTGVSEGNG